MAAPQRQAPNPTTLILARLGDFFAHRTPWHRRLWNVGTTLGLTEVIEYADACLTGAVPSTDGLRYVVGTAKREVGCDPGAAPLASEITSRLDELDTSPPSKVPVTARDELAHLVRRLDDDYLDNWCVSTSEPPVEFTARAFAAHLLDLGLSPDHLHRWITAVAADLTSVGDLAKAARAMVNRMPQRSFDVFVPCDAPYGKPQADGGRVSWLDGHAAAAWLRESVPVEEPGRHSGGFLLRIESRDPWSAVEAARVTIAQADARAKVARPSDDTIRIAGWARIAGNARRYGVRSTHRQMEIPRLLHASAAYRFDGGLPPATNDALELVSYAESPTASAAITGAWFAIEALLIRAKERKHHLAADRLAALVACSLPRAELTHLAYQHRGSTSDSLKRSLADTLSTHAKALLVERHLMVGKRLSLSESSDLAAQDRIIAILHKPMSELARIKEYLTDSLRRLYNQRNTIAHAGSLRSSALHATTRTSLSLVGAGLDRIVNAQLEADGELEPLALVARAEVELGLVGSPGGRALSSLLD